jgi:cytoskeletal protein RodZ
MNRRIEKIDEEISQDDDLGEIDTPATGAAYEKGKMSELEKKEHAGALLKRTREAQGLSLEIVHEATKIPLDVLRAIEEGYQVRLLSPFYYNGFVKMYANYLDVDVSQVMDEVKQEALSTPRAPQLDEFELPQWVGNLFSRARKQQMVILAGIFLIAFILSKIAGFITSTTPRVAQERDTPKVVQVKKEIKKVAEPKHEEVRLESPKLVAPKITPNVKSNAEPDDQAQPTVPVVQPVLPAAIQKNITLTVRANQNSWLRVKVDKGIVFQSTLRIGAVETWFADEEIEISGRNINQLEFELNGKMIGTLGRKDRNAKKIVITENGLSVKQ